ncbi:hypothetical protein [Cyanobium gracile]|uniref:Uncharacterized protein n=1 Tax=Cyanobium gracile UHCC 0281 TaxID=3110309 RepID=A0ABU5SYZ6_9CYAN|nr:hypothetical protein [Cyanobium gracile]MEA5443628.1 hypothetical protein [Cyanobium gracile UHCC 0281]
MLAALASLVIVGTGTTGLRTGDLPFLAFLIAPYFGLGLLAWRERERPRLSNLLFVAVLVLSLGGTLLLGIDSYRFHTVPEHRLVQRMTILTVPMLQSTAVIAIALLLQVNRMLAGHGRAGTGRSSRR